MRMIKLSLLALCAAVQCVQAASPTPLMTPTQSINSSGWQWVRSMPQGNVTVSPTSIWTALGMAHAGAAGETAREMAQVLKAPDDRTFFTDPVALLQKELSPNKDARIQLFSANRMWTQQGLAFSQPFTQNLQSQFNSSVGVLDFKNQSEPARASINDWVAQQTHKQIQTLLPPNSVGPQTALVLSNALYLKAPWTYTFQPDMTRAQAFQLSAGQSVQVPFMRQEITTMAGKMGKGASAATVCELPYAQGQLKMVLYIPSRVDGLKAVLEQLDRVPATLEMQAVQIQLPKWHAQQSLDLNAVLQQKGMRKAFDKKQADFSGMRADKDLYISKVVHQSVIDVSEAGTEAAAATGVVMMMRSSMPLNPPLVVNADRPFAWSIVDSKTGMALFAGVVRDPRSK
jgi:serpin B